MKELQPLDSTRHINYAESHIGSTATKSGAAAHKTAQNEIDKKTPYWPAHTHIFYPFATNTLAIELTQMIGRRITTITEDTRETTFLPFHGSAKRKCGFFPQHHGKFPLQP